MPFYDTLQMDFNTTAPDFYHINYIAKGKNYFAPLYLEKGNMQITSAINNGKLVVEHVTGSILYGRIESWKKIHQSIIAAKDSVAMDSFLLKSYADNIDNLFSFSIGLKYLEIHQNNKLQLYSLLPLIARQNDSVKAQFGFSMMNNQLQGILKNNSVHLSNYQLVNRNGETVNANTRSASYVILDFWFVGCLPCEQDHQKIDRLLAILKNKKAEFISISRDTSFNRWNSYLNKHKFYWQHYKVAESPSLISQLGIEVYPTYLLLDTAGKILFSSHLLDEIIEKLQEQP
ncbi:MAG: TlpA family protein disulfide reductase [Candidatus Dadabacteria bacterium]